MEMNMVAMAVASLVVGNAIASELSVATETRKDYTVHSHDKKVNISSSISCLLNPCISCFLFSKIGKH